MPTVDTPTAPVPKAGFWWGAATAAYQIEGATAADRRVPSIWDTFSAEPGRIAGGDTGDTATDHYHRYREDVDIMAGLGLTAYRFSISWCRSADLGFYDRLVDELLARGISPAPTLYHWDLPQALEDRGGWPNRDTAHHFADYAQRVADRLGDRVPLWFTVNEPWCSAFLGYGIGVHAPGRRSHADAFKAAHHLMLGHGLAARILKRPHNQVSVALNAGAVRAVSDDPLDRDAARRIDTLLNLLFWDPILRGTQPAGLPSDHIRDGDLATINAPLDFLGVNYYQPDLVGHSATRDPGTPYPGCEDVAFHKTPGPVTDMDWVIDPTGLRDVLTRLHHRYGIPLAVTENGAAYDDQPRADGTVDDQQRIGYLRDHLRAAFEAGAAGADLRGFFVWSLLDNFEWAYGFGKRFGLVHVDYRTLARTVKASGQWLRNVIATGHLP